MTWWKGTLWHKKDGTRIDWQLKKMLAEVWDEFIPVADTTTGKPGVLCVSCNQVLAHPTIKGAGTSSMKKHLATDKCRRQQAKTSIR